MNRRQTYSFEIDNKIQEKRAAIQDVVKRCYNFKKSITLEGIFAHLNHRGDRNSFYDFMAAYIRKPPEKLEPNTLKKYVTTLTHLKAFRKELYFHDIENSLIRDFVRLCKSTWNWEARLPVNTSKPLKK